MRYSVRKSGRIAAIGQLRATIDEALELALDHLKNASPDDNVTLEDHETGMSYRNDDIRRLATAVENERA